MKIFIFLKFKIKIINYNIFFINDVKIYNLIKTLFIKKKKMILLYNFN